MLFQIVSKVSHGSNRLLCESLGWWTAAASSFITELVRREAAKNEVTGRAEALSSAAVPERSIPSYFLHERAELPAWSARTYLRL